jgi:hypothetical protein
MSPEEMIIQKENYATELPHWSVYVEGRTVLEEI